MVPHKQWRRGVARQGEFASFPYDRSTVERFREAFPRARWNDERRSWFVPGKTAARRIERWLARESEHTDIHGDLKGRDAYDFEPIVSRYLEVSDDLRIRTPYSRSVIELLREIPWAHWDEDMGVWRVPFRSYEELRRCWPRIEEAARRSEPDERKRRRYAEKGSEVQRAARARAAERRRRRYPLTTDDPPPLGRPVATVQYGIVTVLDFLGEVAEPAALAQYYPQADQAVDHVWGRWRRPTFAELVATWPARKEPGPEALSRGWWQPTLAELRIARRNARSMARRQQARKPAGVAAHRTRAE
ncbi:hypothetical protein [Sinorhizobium americanum]|uniref:Uncharacterized protein n=1 Tax=Sinorhizobium americanum TaxID=194963 RepID=A0A1L3LXE0_9HYPH|nr:hypothetical protein [Sinorhizobium americanum]APG94716.1 hypothetical protein SAMCFNEI73_pC1004 [Sinorhizobium americanum]OAP48749.1 hypothetical protein ATC00_24090 [Sinorhizobium americanum]